MEEPDRSILSIREEYVAEVKGILDEAGVSYSVEDNDRTKGAKDFIISDSDGRFTVGVLMAIPSDAHSYQYVGSP